MSFCHSLAFAALFTAISLSVCCPIGECSQLPNVYSYLYAARSHHAAPLQTTVNVSTRIDIMFQPHRFPVEIEDTDNVLQDANGCEDANFNFTSRSVGVDSPCPWKYVCDYNPRRIPAFIFHAECNSATPQGAKEEWNGVCDEVYYPISYIVTKSCDPLEDAANAGWELMAGTVPISCNLQRHSTL